MDIHSHKHATLQIEGEFEKISMFFPGPTRPDVHPVVRVGLYVRNHGSAPIPFTFNTTQSFDIELVNSDGAVVSRWSTGKVFGQVVSTRPLEPQSSWHFEGDLPLPNGASGHYTVRILVTADLKPGAQSPLHLQFGP
jgi:Intracellular proteinase inhibitor